MCIMRGQTEAVERKGAVWCRTFVRRHRPHDALDGCFCRCHRRWHAEQGGIKGALDGAGGCLQQAVVGDIVGHIHHGERQEGDRVCQRYGDWRFAGSACCGGRLADLSLSSSSVFSDRMSALDVSTARPAVSCHDDHAHRSARDRTSPSAPFACRRSYGIRTFPLTSSRQNAEVSWLLPL